MSAAHPRIDDRPPTRRRISSVGAGLVAAVVLLAGVAGCTSDGDEPSATTTASTTSVAGEVIGAGSKYRATIRRATDNVPHITGATIESAAFGQGYASGEDHTCDLADQVVKIRGERARWLGAGEEDANIDSDMAWRGIGIYERSAADWVTAAKESKDLFIAFAAGWNLHLSEVGADGVTGWCTGQPWLEPIEPVDVYAYARSVILLASSAQLIGYMPTATPPVGAEVTTTTTTPSSEPLPTTTVDPTPNLRSADAPVDFDAAAFANGLDLPDAEEIGSNGWAIGEDRSESGGGMLMANPHFPWNGELRFWENHLTVPGEIDIYGAQLSGVPGIGIGFTEEFAWTHTVSAGNRFTAYRLDLKPGSPTTYRYGNEWREIVPTVHEIEVLDAAGQTTSTVERTTWASHYGPVIDFPGFGWSDTATITVRDANIDNDEFIEQYFDMLRAQSFDEFVDVHNNTNGVPLFNTIATSADGRAWYADTSATPNLSSEAIAAYEASLQTDMIVKIAADSGAVLLDGSDPLFEWVDEPGARDPGLVPASRQPSVERSDYVFNANDSFWVPNASALLSGDYSPLHGRQGTARSARTRENATVLEDTTAGGASGADGKFTLDELADAALANRGYMARALLAPVVQRCKAASGPVVVGATEAANDVAGLPAGSIDITAACTVLAGWDGIYDLDRAGPPLWREFLLKFASSDLADVGTGTLWAEPFRPAQPIASPAGLADAPAGSDDPVLVNLARAVQALDIAGFEPEATLGAVQFVSRNGLRIPIHGGSGVDGTTNVVGYGGLGATVRDPALLEAKRERLVAGSSLYRLDGETGTPIVTGTSFLMALEFGAAGPSAKAFLTYGETEDPADPIFTAATQRFSEKNWRTIEFRDAEIAKATTSTLTVKG